jgi:hypothetical protein
LHQLHGYMGCRRRKLHGLGIWPASGGVAHLLYGPPCWSHSVTYGNPQ